MYKQGCWYLVAPEPFGDGVRDLEECSGRVSEESAARTYCLSGRTWTLLTLPVPVGERRVKGSGMAGVPSQREGTGREERRKREGRGSLAMGGNGPGKRRKREGRGSLTAGGNGPGKRRNREGRGSLAMRGNGPGRNGKSGKAGVPSQWEGTGQEEMEKAGKPGFPHNGRERARKKGESGLSVG
jgi:hypothetical protein